MKIAFTGHRPNKLGNDYDLTSPLTKKIQLKIIESVEEHFDSISWKELINSRMIWITGMALGIDTLVALTAIECKIQFIAAISCVGQWSKWPKKSVELYDKILSNPLCTKYLVSNRTYFDGCMDIRNKWMVDQLTEPIDRLIAVHDGSKGGTYNCVEYAKKTIGEEKIITINPKLLT
jgi:uncharacterized phage-like protein YoqJ